MRHRCLNSLTYEPWRVSLFVPYLSRLIITIFRTVNLQTQRGLTAWLIRAGLTREPVYSTVNILNKLNQPFFRRKLQTFWQLEHVWLWRFYFFRDSDNRFISYDESIDSSWQNNLYYWMYLGSEDCPFLTRLITWSAS